MLTATKQYTSSAVPVHYVLAGATAVCMMELIVEVHSSAGADAALDIARSNLG